MACSRAALAMVLGGVALTLSGCGSSGSNDSGGTPSPPGPPGPKPAKPLDFVSQSVEGSIKVKFDAAGLGNITGTAQEDIQLHIDVDTLNMAIGGKNGTATVSVMGHPAPVTIDEGVILSFTDQKVTAKYNISLAGTTFKANCTYLDTPIKMTAEEIKTLISKVLGLLTTIRAADGFNRMEHSIDVQSIPKAPPNATGKVDIAIEEDDDAVLRKFSVDANVKQTAKDPANTVHVEMDATKVTKGKPDASNFVVPKAWGKCFPAPKTQDFGLPREAILSRLIFQLASIEPKEKTEESKGEAVIAI